MLEGRFVLERKRDVAEIAPGVAVVTERLGAVAG